MRLEPIKEIFTTAGTARDITGILLLFFISIAVRLPNINRPLSTNYEWNAAQILVTHKIWYEQGAWKHHLIPVMTYSGDANKNISNDARMKNADGVWYYMSHPLLAWIAPYFAFWLIGVRPDVLPLQIFNLSLHFLDAVLIYLLVKQLVRNAAPVNRQVSALVASTVYIFTPSALWYHCNTYNIHWLVYPMFISSVYVFVRFMDSESDDEKRRWIVWMGFLSFLRFYTDWFGALFAAVVCTYALIHYKDRAMRWLVVSIVMGACFAWLLLIVQLSTFFGVSSLLEYFAGRLTAHTGYFEGSDKGLHIYNLFAWKRLLSHYVTNFGAFLFVFLVSVCVAALLGNEGLMERIQKADRRWLAVACITMFPVWIQHLVMFNHDTVHSFAVLAFLVAISTFIGLSLSRIIAKLGETRGRQEMVGVVGSILCVLAIAVAVSVNDYRRQNSNGHSLYKMMGDTIKSTAKEDEVVFLDSGGSFVNAFGEVIPHIAFYAGRNIASWKQDDSPQALLESNSVNRGIVFKLVKIGKQYRLQHRYIERQGVLSKAN